ncbi:hypothetical protein PRUPE_6G269600 [Prunus persica]|uniref:F-box domain-containing protein n=1 Tax=Prunus persica TaxID=3760 RepID=A0A251NWD6_PRUPE|nr:hypothetical protein PRUPE_6G269600 [Prunus persica]
MRRKGKLPAASASCEDQATCSENVTDDRFSNLPDDVAHIILSFLTFKDAARVGAASKRCRQFYVSVPLVDFDAIWRGIKRTHQNKVRMMNSVDRYLFYRGDNRIQRFCISWSFVSSETENEYCDDHSRVITWIHKAVRCNVEELDVRICGLANTFSLPSCVFLSQSLRSLSVNLNTQILETPSLSFSSNILYLELINLKIADERLFKWISCCCKCIKKLQILNIAGVRNISIESSSLEHFRAWISRDLLHLNISGEKLETIDMFLWFEESYPASSSPSLKIFAPNLKNLKWKGTVGNSPNLGEFGCSKEGSMAAPIFDNLCNLRIHCTRLDDYLVPIVVSLLRGMPNLNTLYIKARSWMLDGKTSSGFGMEYWKLQNLAFLHQLNEVTIEYSDDGSNEIQFARYILENAQNLKKMVILLHYEKKPSKVVAEMLELVHIQGIRNITIESSFLEYFHGFIQSDILHVNISGEKLEGIDICLWFHGYPEISSNSLKIFAPNLKNLNWNSSNGRYSPNLGKLMSLEKVQLFLDPRVNELDKVLCRVCSAKDLIINERTIKAIFKDGSTAVPILDNICNLTLHFTSLNDDLVPAVASLLKGMPNLNFLSMKTTNSRSWDAQTSAGFGIEYWKLQNLAFLHQLKEVTIEYPDNVSNELEFRRYILEHAQNLMKMVNLLNFEDTQFEVLARMLGQDQYVKKLMHIDRYTTLSPGRRICGHRDGKYRSSEHSKNLDLRVPVYNIHVDTVMPNTSQLAELKGPSENYPNFLVSLNTLKMVNEIENGDPKFKGALSRLQHPIVVVYLPSIDAKITGPSPEK